MKLFPIHKSERFRFIYFFAIYNICDMQSNIYYYIAHGA